MSEETDQPFQSAPETPSTQEETQPQKSPEVESSDDVCICCRSLSARGRKIGYYVTLFIGVLCFLFAITNLFDSEKSPVWYALIGALIAIFCPLWISNCGKIWNDLKNPVRLPTAIVMVVSLIGLVAFGIIYPLSILCFIFSLATVASSLWYALSFHPIIQEKLKNCCIYCCNKLPNPMAKKKEEPAGNEGNVNNNSDPNANTGDKEQYQPPAETN